MHPTAALLALHGFYLCRWAAGGSTGLRIKQNAAAGEPMLEWMWGEQAWIRGYSASIASYTPIDWEEAGETVGFINQYDFKFLKVVQ